MVNLRRHVNPTNALAFAALFIVLGAGAYAAGLGKNSVKSKQIKDGSIATKDLKDGSFTSREVGSLTGADIADDSIASADIQGGLRVPTAANANAVNGVKVKEIDFQSPIANGVVKSIVDFPGVFRIDAQCANVGDGLDITAFTAVANSRISMIGWKAQSNGEQLCAFGLSPHFQKIFEMVGLLKYVPHFANEAEARAHCAANTTS